MASPLTETGDACGNVNDSIIMASPLTENGLLSTNVNDSIIMASPLTENGPPDPPDLADPPDLPDPPDPPGGSFSYSPNIACVWGSWR